MIGKQSRKRAAQCMPLVCSSDTVINVVKLYPTVLSVILGVLNEIDRMNHQYPESIGELGIML